MLDSGLRRSATVGTPNGGRVLRRESGARDSRRDDKSDNEKAPNGHDGDPRAIMPQSVRGVPLNEGVLASELTLMFGLTD